jgi:leucyl-tRNA synthetase
MLNRLWDLVTGSLDKISAADEDIPSELDDTNRALRRKSHQCIMRVTDAIEGGFQFNTAIARCNELLHQLRNAVGNVNPVVLREVLETVIRILSPIVPHFAEELWERLGHSESIFKAGWPVADNEVAREEELVIPVQVNGKLRARLTLAPDASKETIESAAKELPEVTKWIEGKTIRKVIVVPGRLINIVAT